MTQKLALMCARHPWRTVAAWIGAIVVAVVLVGAFLGGGLTGEGHVTNDPESLRAADLLDARFPQKADFDELVIVRSETLRARDPVFGAKVAQVSKAMAATGGTASVVTYATTGDRGLLSPDGHAQLLMVTLTDPGEDHVEDVMAAVEAADGQ